MEHLIGFKAVGVRRRSHDRIVRSRAVRIQEGEPAADDAAAKIFLLGLPDATHDLGIDFFEPIPSVGSFEREADDSHRCARMHQPGQISELVPPVTLRPATAGLQRVVRSSRLLLHDATEVLADFETTLQPRVHRMVGGFEAQQQDRIGAVSSAVEFGVLLVQIATVRREQSCLGDLTDGLGTLIERLEGDRRIRTEFHTPL